MSITEQPYNNNSTNNVIGPTTYHLQILNFAKIDKTHQNPTHFNGGIFSECVPMDNQLVF